MSNAPRSPRVTVIVPTLNEEQNIDELVGRLVAAFQPLAYGIEIIIADGGSSDRTAEKARGWEARSPVRCLEIRSGHGLAGDVLVAVQQARSDVIVVMDADLSHPPEKTPELAGPVLSGARDMVIGSRYVAGGGTPGWPWSRRFISRVATVLARGLVNAQDSLSGFFAIHREKLLAIEPLADGFKIGLEALRANQGLRMQEIPIVFNPRKHGRSKFSFSQGMTYLRRLCVLATRLPRRAS